MPHLGGMSHPQSGKGVAGSTDLLATIELRFRSEVRRLTRP